MGKVENDIQREPVLPHELLIHLLLNLLKEMKKKGFFYLGPVLKVKVVNTVSIVWRRRERSSTEIAESNYCHESRLHFPWVAVRDRDLRGKVLIKIIDWLVSLP